jgi:hypothetical protein
MNVHLYEGTKPYVCISFSPNDVETAEMIIEGLSKNGYRLWFDNSTGRSSEQLRNVDTHLSKAKLCVAIISENFVRTHSCRKQINTAVMGRIEVLSVFIENTILTPIEELQLLSNPHIDRFRYTNEELFIADMTNTTKLSAIFALCREKDYGTSKSPVYSNLLLCEQTGETIKIGKSAYTVGRTDPDKPSDYMVIDNQRKISRQHFSVITRSDKCYVRDNVSKNGTKLNGKMLVPNVETRLHSGDIISIHTVVFTYQRVESEEI